VHRSFLVFAAALILLMAGALFYAARLPVEHAQPVAAEPVDSTADAPVYPSFTLADLDGNERHFSEWEGKHRLLNFWATWCAPCRREIGVDFIGMPFTMIVAADGELINTHIGEIMDSHLEHIVRVLTMLDNGEIDKASARKALNFL